MGAHCSSCHISEDRTLEGEKVQGEGLHGLMLGPCVAAEGTGGSKARDKEVLGRDVWTPTWQDADLTGGGLRDPHTEAGRHPRVRKGGGKQPA